MSLFVVDVEADGPAPGLYSMVSFGAVSVRDLADTFYGETAPISDNYIPDTLAVSGITREKHLTFRHPKTMMAEFRQWITEKTKGRPVFISDNLAFDWQFINYYFHAYLGDNPFGWSGRRIGDIYCGMERNMYSSWKHLRKTIANHNPVDDAMGNAEALLAMKDMGLRF